MFVKSPMLRAISINLLHKSADVKMLIRQAEDLEDSLDEVCEPLGLEIVVVEIWWDVRKEETGSVHGDACVWEDGLGDVELRVGYAMEGDGFSEGGQCWRWEKVLLEEGEIENCIVWRSCRAIPSYSGDVETATTRAGTRRRELECIMNERY